VGLVGGGGGGCRRWGSGNGGVVVVETWLVRKGVLLVGFGVEVCIHRSNMGGEMRVMSVLLFLLPRSSVWTGEVDCGFEGFSGLVAAG
jgi:hypothetical protein